MYPGVLWLYTNVIWSTGHMQMVALLQTQKEQSKLEKLLLQQQRELQRLCKAHEVTKTGNNIACMHICAEKQCFNVLLYYK